MKKRNKLILVVIFALILALYIILSIVKSKDFTTPMMLFIMFSGFLYFSITFSRKRRRCSAYVLGTVVDLRVGNGSGVSMQHPLVKFEANGVEYKVWYDFGKSGVRYKIGDDFWVRYNPEDPTEITQEDSSAEKMEKVFPIVTVILGIALAVSTLFAFV